MSICVYVCVCVYCVYVFVTYTTLDNATLSRKEVKRYLDGGSNTLPLVRTLMLYL